MNKTASRISDAPAGRGVHQALDWLDQLGLRLINLSGPRFDLVHALTGASEDETPSGAAMQFDVRRVPHIAPREQDIQRTMFAYGSAALAAKLMLADGPINTLEYRFFSQIFAMTGMSQGRLKALLMAAAKDSAPHRQYARQMRSLYAGNRPMREDLLLRLCRVALADGPLSPEEFTYLGEVGGILGFSREEVALGADQADGPSSGDPCRILKISPDASPADVQQAYHERMRYCHPDRWEGKDEYREIYRLAHAKAVAINAAYRQMMKERRLH